MSTTLRIEIYTTPTCPDCLALKRWLNTQSLPFVEHDLRDSAIAEKAKRRTGVRVAPITIIDGKHIFFGTFAVQRPEIEAVLDLTRPLEEIMTYLTLPQLGRRTPVSAEQTILQAALDAGVPYPHGCRSGRCGSCKSRLISGDVELGKHSPFALTEEDRAGGLILACRSVPTTDVTVEWLDVDYVAMPTVAQGATVVAVERKTHDILAIRLKLDDRSAFCFAAGQYLSLAMPGAPARHYSMASRPDDELVELHVRLVPGGRTSCLLHALLKADDRIEIEGPAGSAYLREAHGGPVVAVAGGSGLAPIKSIVETALGAGMSQPIHLYFGARTKDDLYLVDHFRALEQRFSNLIFVPVLSRAADTGWRTGFVSDALAEDHQQLAGAKAYVAGPPTMVDAVGAVLTARGIIPSDIHADVFFTPKEDIKAVVEPPKSRQGHAS